MQQREDLYEVTFDLLALQCVHHNHVLNVTLIGEHTSLIFPQDVRAKPFPADAHYTVRRAYRIECDTPRCIFRPLVNCEDSEHPVLEGSESGLLKPGVANC